MFFLDKLGNLGTLVADFPTQKPTDLANSRTAQRKSKFGAATKHINRNPTETQKKTNQNSTQYILNRKMIATQNEKIEENTTENKPT